MRFSIFFFHLIQLSHECSSKPFYASGVADAARQKGQQTSSPFSRANGQTDVRRSSLMPVRVLEAFHRRVCNDSGKPITFFFLILWFCCTFTGPPKHLPSFVYAFALLAEVRKWKKDHFQASTRSLPSAFSLLLLLLSSAAIAWCLLFFITATIESTSCIAKECTLFGALILVRSFRLQTLLEVATVQRW